MAVVNGNDIFISVDGDVIGCTTSSGFESTREVIDATCKDNNGARNVLLGALSATLPFDGLWNPASGYSVEDLLNLNKDGTLVEVKFGVTDTLVITANARLSTISLTGSVNSAATYSGTFEVDGEWDLGTT